MKESGREERMIINMEHDHDDEYYSTILIAIKSTLVLCFLFLQS